MKEEKGITMIALVVTILVLAIIATIGIGLAGGISGDINETNKQVLVSELAQVRQAVLETYIKYKQTQNEDYLLGDPLSYGEAVNGIQIEGEEELELKLDEAMAQGEKAYYKISSDDLFNLGINKSEEEYIVNYATGEVFNIKTKMTEDGEILYYGD